MIRPGWRGEPAPRPLRGEHLGERLSALVDGELGHDARDRALAHVAECRDCLRALEAERWTKAQVSSLGAPPVPPDLTLRLLSVPAAGEPANPRLARRSADRRASPASRPGSPAPAAGPPRARRRSPGPAETSSRPPTAGARRRRRATAVAGGFLSVAGIALGAAFVVGTPASAGSPNVPSVATFSGERGGAARWWGSGSSSRDARALLRGGPLLERLRTSTRRGGFHDVVQPVDLDVAGVSSPVVAPADVVGRPPGALRPAAPPSAGRSGR